MNAPLKHDPHKTSFYITDALYEEIIADFSNWQRDDLVIQDIAERVQFRSLLEHEARLLDQDRLEDWLTLAVVQLWFWMPIGTASAAFGGWVRDRISAYQGRRWAPD